MKKLATIIIASLISCSLAVAQSGREKKEAAEKKASDQRQRSMGGYKTNNEMKDEKGEITPVKPTSDGNEDRAETRQQERNAPGPVTSPNEIPTTSTAPEDSASQASNAPAVIQSTTSESGSPSILSEDNGRGRDGTGNVQRAKPNMAGAAVPESMTLDRENTKQTDNTNGASRIREEEEVPARVSDTNGQVKTNNNENESARSDDKNKESKKEKRKKSKRKDKDS